MSGVGMFGLGITQVRPVSSYSWSRFQFFSWMTWSSFSRLPFGVERQVLRVEQLGQLTHGHAVLLDDLLLAHTRGVTGLEHRAARVPADRVRTVQDDELAPVRTAAIIASYIVQM